MPLPNDELREREIAEKTVLLLLAVGLNALEFFIPRLPFLPWLKPGLANVITIIWIVRFGTADALLFSLARAWIAGCYFGFSFVSLALSASGGVTATLVMGLAWNVLGKRGMMGSIGIGMIGAAAHNAGQLLAVYALMAGTVRIFYQLPAMAAASLAFGAVVGAAVPSVNGFLNRRLGDALVAPANPFTPGKPSRRDAAASWLIVGASLALVAVPDLIALAACAAVATIAAAAASGRMVSTLLFPLRRFWVLFACIGALYLVDPYGTRIEGVPYLTQESLRAAAVQWLRLWTWLELSLLLTKFRFHLVFFGSLTKLFPRRQPTLAASLIAFEYFPLIAQTGRAQSRQALVMAFRHPIAALKTGIGDIVGAILARLGEKGDGGDERRNSH